MTGKIRATLIELFSRVIPINQNDKVYQNDVDNLYPNRLERIINNSPTASRCANLMAKYIAGAGLEDPTTNVSVNKKKGYKLTDIINIASNSVAYQYGVFFHLNYGYDFKVNKVDVLEYSKCRTLREDADKNKGRVIYKDFETKETFGAKKPQWFYPYNPNKEVIMAQMKADSPNADTIEELIKGYRGQVYYLNLTPQYQYALSLIDSVYNDADTDFRLSLYVNKQMRTGFLDQTIVISQGIDDETDRDINEKFKGLMGAENATNLMHLSVPSDSNVDLDKALFIKQIPSSFDPKMVELLSKRIKTNILGAFNNIPEALILSSEGSLFGANSETYGKMKDFYTEQTAFERTAIENTLLMFGFNVKIKPITSLKKSSFEETNAIKLKSQAELKGSVGGVTSLIELVNGVSTGILDLNSAVEIVKEIYGFDEETARKMLGTPKIIDNANLQ